VRRHVGKHVTFGVVHKGVELLPSNPELISDMPPGLDGIVMNAWRIAAAFWPFGT
jgi:hypothetical protein